MDNYNGANQLNYNQYMQSNVGQYQQLQQNGIAGNNMNNNTKTKKRWVKWLFVVGIPVVAIVTTILLFVLLNTKYDIDSPSKFKSACKKAFGASTRKVELTKQEKEIYGYESCYSISSLGRAYATWYKFESEETAENYFNFEKVGLKKGFGGGSRTAFDLKVEDNYVELSYSNLDVIHKEIVLIEDKYVIYLRFSGDKKEVEKKKEKFLDEIK